MMEYVPTQQLHIATWMNITSTWLNKKSWTQKSKGACAIHTEQTNRQCWGRHGLSNAHYTYASGVGGAKEIEGYTEMPHFFVCRLIQPTETLKTPLHTKEKRNWTKHLVLTPALCTHVYTYAPITHTHMQHKHIQAKNILSVLSELVKWSVVKSTYCSPRGFQFCSQHPWWWLPAICNSSTTGSDVLPWSLWTLVLICTYPYLGTHTYTYFKILKIF